MKYRVERIAGRVMAVNSFLVHGPDGVVVVDGMLTVSDAVLVRAAVERVEEAEITRDQLSAKYPDVTYTVRRLGADVRTDPRSS